MSKASLRQEINGLLMQIRIQKKTIIDFCSENGIDAYSIRDSYGNFVFVPILSAESTALAALATLEP